MPPPRSRTSLALFVAFLVTMALSATGCAELERPTAYSPGPTPSLAIGQGEVDAQPVAETVPANDNDASVPSTSIDYIPLLLIASDKGVVQYSQGVTRFLPGLQDRAPSAIYDDLVGGLVIDEPGVGVTYLPVQGEPELIDDGAGTLLDVGYWDGAPRAFVRVDDRRVDRIQLVDERAGDLPQRLEHVQLADNESLVDFSASRGIQAVIVQDDDCGDLRFYGAEGEPLAIGVPNPPECTFPGRPAYGAVAISPEGDAVAYTTVSYRGDGTEAGTDLVILELLTEQSYVPSRIGENLDRISSLSFDGGRVAFVKNSADSTTVNLLDLTNPTARSLDTLDATPLGTVAFARNPILLEADDQ